MDDSSSRGGTAAQTRHDKERRLLRAWLLHGRREARDQLYLGLLPLARRIALRYEPAGETLDDLIQVASIGVLKAIDRFDLNRTTSLTAYAARMIDGELRHHLRDSSGLLHVPRALYARIRSVSGAASRLAARLGRVATPEEIAAELALTPGEVVDALEAERALRLESLEAIAARSGDAPPQRAGSLGVDDPRYELIEQHAAIDCAWRSLDPRERDCLRLRFVEDLTYAEIARQIGLSTSHAERLTSRALSRLQAVAAAGEGA